MRVLATVFVIVKMPETHIKAVNDIIFIFLLMWFNRKVCFETRMLGWRFVNSQC